MLFSSLNIVEGSELQNLTLRSLEAYPISPNAGELILRTDEGEEGVHIFNGDEWARMVDSLNILDVLGYTPLNRAGDVMSGILNLGNYRITTLGAPTAGTDAANKLYVDTAIANAPDRVAGSTTNVQFNNNGVFGGSSGLTFTTASNVLTLGTNAVPGVFSGTDGAVGVVSGLVVRGGNSSDGTTGGQLDISGGTSASGTGGAVRIRTGNAALSTRIAFLANGAWEIGGQTGNATQALLSNGASSTPTWQDILLGNRAETIGGAWSFTLPITGTTPTLNSHLATKSYVDSVATGLDVRDPVRAATLSDITLSGTQTIDGVALIAGQRVLVKNQSDQTQNGIYIVDAGAWSRSTDADTGGTEVKTGMYTYVEEGTINAKSGWVLTTPNPITVGSSNLVFAQFSSAGNTVGGAGITQTGNVLDIVAVSASRIVVGANDIDLATVGTAGTYSRVTTDAWGRVTVGGDISVSGVGLAFNTSTGQLSSNATSANTASTIVARDASGNFSASNITMVSATLTGNLSVGTTSAGGAIELGRRDGVASSPLIDFHSGATNIDYDSRIIASGGNGTNGAGSLQIIATGGLRVPSQLIFDEVGGTNRRVHIRTAGNSRWQFGSDAVAETGTNAGSNFVVSRYDDTGLLIDSPFSISRATGAVVMTGTVTAPTFVGALTGNATSASSTARINTSDTRSTNNLPNALGTGVAYELKLNTTDGLTDGGTFHAVLSAKNWTDASGGNAHQIAFSDNGDLYYRLGNTNTNTWGSYTRLPKINPAVSQKDGDIQVSGSTISIWANGSWRQIFPAIYS